MLDVSFGAWAALSLWPGPHMRPMRRQIVAHLQQPAVCQYLAMLREMGNAAMLLWCPWQNYTGSMRWYALPLWEEAGKQWEARQDRKVWNTNTVSKDTKMTRIWGDEGRYRLSEISHGDSRDLLSAESLLAPLVPRASCQVTSEVFQPLPQALPSLWFPPRTRNSQQNTTDSIESEIWSFDDIIWIIWQSYWSSLCNQFLQTMARHVAGHVMDLTGIAWHRRLREPSLAAPPSSDWKLLWNTHICHVIRMLYHFIVMYFHVTLY